MTHIGELMPNPQPNPALTDYVESLRETARQAEEDQRVDNALADPHCLRCRGLGWLRDPDLPAGQKNLIPCPCTREARAQRRSQELEAISGLHAQEQEVTLDNFFQRPDGQQATARMVELVREFARKPWGMLTLWGGSGNFKTAALMALVNDARIDNRVAMYVTLKTAVDYVRAGNAPGAGLDARQRLDRLTECDLLCLDEADKIKETEWVAEFMAAFFDRRYRLAREGLCHTVVAMNQHPNRMPPPIRSRLYEFVIFENTDGDLRPALGKMLRQQIAALRYEPEQGALELDDAPPKGDWEKVYD